MMILMNSSNLKVSFRIKMLRAKRKYQIALLWLHKSSQEYRKMTSHRQPNLLLNLLANRKFKVLLKERDSNLFKKNLNENQEMMFKKLELDQLLWCKLKERKVLKVPIISLKTKHSDRVNQKHQPFYWRKVQKGIWT